MVSVLALSDQTDILVIKRYFSSHDWLEEYLFLSKNIEDIAQIWEVPEEFVDIILKF